MRVTKLKARKKEIYHLNYSNLSKNKTRPKKNIVKQSFKIVNVIASENKHFSGGEIKNCIIKVIEEIGLEKLEILRK